MDNLLRYLDAFKPVLRTAQYALNGEWERATAINLDTPPMPAADIDASLAIELFYELNDQRVIFLGIRYTDGLALAEAPAQFFGRIMETLPDAQSRSPREQLELLGVTLNDDARTYTNQAIKYVELGVEGHWKSAGSTVLRRAGDPVLDDTSLEAHLRRHPQLLRNTKGMVALEFATEKPPTWVGVQVSHRADEEFVTDLGSLVKLVNLS